MTPSTRGPRTEAAVMPAARPISVSPSNRARGPVSGSKVGALITCLLVVPPPSLPAPARRAEAERPRGEGRSTSVPEAPPDRTGAVVGHAGCPVLVVPVRAVGWNRAMAKIKVYLLDDHEVVREGLKVMLEASGDVEVIGESASAEDAAHRIPALRPDVA